MPDLSAYQNFSVKLNYVTNQIIITDTGTYPGGVAPNLVGKLTILQPDGVAVVGTFADIVYSSGSLQPCTKALRVDSLGDPQCGSYTITYEVDHPSYTPSTISKTFILNYTRKTLDLEEDFDVFTPSLFYRDNTDFAQTLFTTTTNTVAWSAILALVGTVTGSADDFDLAYLGDYYDAEYAITYQRDLLYTHQTYTYLTLQDRYTETISTTADTPPSVNDIIECLNNLKAYLDTQAGNCFPTAALEATYQQAMARYDHLIHKLRIGDGNDAEDLLEEILSLTTCAHTVYRGVIIQPYDLSVYAGGFGSSVLYNYTVPSDVTQVTLAALNGKTVKTIKLDGIGRQFTNGADGDTAGTGAFIVVTGSTPRKFKYGGTLYQDQWLQIEYTT